MTALSCHPERSEGPSAAADGEDSSPAAQNDIIQQINDLRRERDAIILAHNYQVPEIQDLADFTGDSLALARRAAATDNPLIVLCGVHFMAETASILCPDRTVLLPDLEAGCSLAASITAAQLRKWKAQFPGAVVVSYVNTSAEVKAESDYCCTSGNAVQVVQAVPEDREILFLPDMFLGAHVERVTGRKMHVWLGECHVHAGIDVPALEALAKQHPRAEALIHPECGCTTPALYLAGEGKLPLPIKVLSTEGALAYNQHVIDVPADVAQRARLPIERMTAIG